MARILHINDYPPTTGGGTEVVMSTTIALLRERGQSVDTFTSADVADTRITPRRYIHNSRAQEVLWAKLAAFRPDIIHLHNFYHLLSPAILTTLAGFKKKHSLRVVMTAHDYHLVCPNSGGTWFDWWTGRRRLIESGAMTLHGHLVRKWDHRGLLHSMLKLAQHLWNYRIHQRQQTIDLVICPSRFVQEMLAPLGMATCVLPHPAPVPIRSAGARPSKLQFIFAGRIEPEKGLNELLGAWPAEYDARLIVVGEGSQLAACKDTCARRKLHGRVEFVGRLPHTETLARIAQSHVLVQPAQVLESYALTLLEALAGGTNVLAADRGAMREIVTASGVGRLFDPNDPTSLATGLAAIRSEFDAGTLNRFDVAPFLWERSQQRYVDRLLRLYEIENVGAIAA